ncbi:uncharacterized protein LOC117420482 isoform X2 [Acipenser ruthenus]|uniref:uncharacterized protein LOC117420482 isoform X2 n=1 Tax=Acipenser ruthenus TaxID=7906 RepID=UPI0027408474|nr:uncharacterized protein LOC117420482 isoform X2 [Acipenser ruthenus]
MVDRDMKEINAVHTVFPYAKVLLCWFHVLQAVHRWIVRRDGGCSQNLSAKNEVIRSMIALKQCSTAAEFEKMSKEVIVKTDRETGSSVISQYLQDHWFRNADMWANFGWRVYHQDSETNNLVERYLEGLHGAQRISDSKTQDTAESALRMKNKGLQNNFVYKSGGHCTVPSEADKAKCYAVDLISMKCECAVSERGNLCKHIEFAKMMCKEQGIDIDGIRKELASSLTEQHCYEWDGKHLIVHCAGSFGVVHVQNQQCTCLANSLGEICVCLRLSELIGTQNPNQEVTDCFVNTTANCQSHNKQLCLKKMISDLKEWCDSSDYKESPELNAVVKRAHQLAFGQYSMASNKIKIIRLHAYRKRIERARSHAIDMHSYQLKEPLNRALYTHRPDSKFKVCSFRKRIIGSRAKNQILKSS